MDNKNKIFIIGISGSGKSFLAKKLSEKFNIEKYDLDDIYWKEKYTVKNSAQESREILNKEINDKKEWICEGIYSEWTEKIVEDANLIIWLDMPKNLMSWRIFKRWIGRKKEAGGKIYDMFSLVRFQRNYKKIRKNKKISFYDAHKNLLKNYMSKVIILKNKKDFAEFVDNLE